MKNNMKRTRYYVIKGESWDCNRNRYNYWNIVDRTLDKTIAQAWSKEASDLILAKLNKGNK
jgi:hypothetical protein